MSTTTQATKPHHEPSRPYGYRFEAINLYTCEDYDAALNMYENLRETHNIHDIQIGHNNPHRNRIIWEIARHIEGNFGLPYDATIIYSEAHVGTITIYTPKKHQWWNDKRRSELSNYLMGLRALLDLLKGDQ